MSQPNDTSEVWQPDEASEVWQPGEASDTPRPSKASDVWQPTEVSDVAQPNTASGVTQPNRASDVPRPIEASAMRQPSRASDVSPPTAASRGKGLVRGRGKQLLIAVGIAVALFVVARQFIGLPGSGGPAVDLTGQQTPASTQPPSATPPVTKIGGTPVVTAPGPIVLLNPGIVRQGATMNVAGSGFDAGSTVDLVLKKGTTDRGQTIASIKADKNGFFMANFPAPDTFNAGPFILEAHQRNSKNLAQATGAISGGAAFVKLGAQVGKVGDVVGWSGTGFQPYETVNVYWNAMGGQPLATFKADGGGNLKATIQIPFAAVGENNLIFIGTKSSSPVTATFLVLSLYPSVKLSSYALRADNILTFTGSGFGPNERVLIYLNTTNGPPLTTAQADAHGGFKNAGGLLVPFSLKGKQNIIFVGEQSRAPTTTTFTILPYMPQAQASTYGSLPGGTISFYASNFARDEVVHVYVGHGGQLVACFKTDDKGNAGAAGSYVVPSNAQPGKLAFTLTGNKSGASTTAVITVMTPSVPVQVPPQPPFTCPYDQAPQTQPNQPPAGGNPGAQPPQQPQPPQQQPQPPQQPPDQPPQPPQQDNPPQGRVTQPAASASLVGLVVTTSLVTHARSARAASSGRAGALAPRGAERNASSVGLDWSALVMIGLIAVGAFLTFVILLRLGSHDETAPDMEEQAPDWLPVASDPPAGGPQAPEHTLNSSPLARPLRLTAAQRYDITSDSVSESESESGPAGEQAVGTVSCSALSAPDNQGIPGVPEVVGRTDTGLKRRGSPNEDSLLLHIGACPAHGCPQPYGLFIVADGMGGHAYGREASYRTTRVMADYVVPRLETAGAAGAISLIGILKGAVETANAGLVRENQARRVNMGTTVTAALLIGDTAHVVNVGDSRTYVYSPRYGLRQITRDHSIIAGLVAVGLLPPEACYTHPRRNQIYRSLGARHDCQVDTFQVPLQPEDVLLLCSDGLWGAVRDPQIETILRASADPHMATARLVHAANENGGPDNVTVIVAHTLDQRTLLTAQPRPQEADEMGGQPHQEGESESALPASGATPDR
jgi:serine/threonine protein phosphatase PrpC